MAKKITDKPGTTTVMNPPEKDIYGKEIVAELNKHVKVIRTEMNKVESSFTKIAFNLHWIYRTEAFKTLGYDNVYTLAKNEFNIARGTANNFINVVERFGKRIDNKFSDEISDEFKDYKSSQLISMLGMNDETLKKINKDMSVRDIKKVKKEASDEKFREGRHDSKVQNSGKNIIDVESSEISNRTVMITLNDLDDYLKHRDTIETMISRAFSVKDKKYKIEVSCVWQV